MNHDKLMPLVFCTLILAACGGGGGGSSATPPSSPRLELAYDIKTLQFSWAAVNDASHYRLFENADGVSGFSQLGGDLTATRVDHRIALYQRINARYLLEACNSDGCSASAELVLSTDLVEAIGYFKATNTEANDEFGGALALSSDGNTLAVGADDEDSAKGGINSDQADNSAADAGAVYVYSRDNGEWILQAYVKASNIEQGDWFGTALALSGDGSTLAVSATGENSAAIGIDGDQGDNSAEAAGAVYVFSRNAGQWSQQAYVKAVNTEEFDRFGRTLALSTDGSTLAVGTILEDSAATGINGDQKDNSASRSGAVYVYGLSGGDWKPQAYVKASNTEVDDFFGEALALSADGSTLAVGAYGEDSAATGINGDDKDNTAFVSGAVYVYVRTGGLWAQQAYVKSSNPEFGDQFSRGALALSGDGETLAVGAYGESSAASGIDGDQANNNAYDAGAVYLYSRSGGLWAQQTYVKASNPDSQDRFGNSLAISADGNILAVGAYREAGAASGINGNQLDNSADDAGAVYVFSRGSGMWSQQAYVKASNTEDNDEFGLNLALSGDGGTLAVGATDEDSVTTGIGGDQSDNSASFAGSVYIY